jgi:hypothetical protein
MPFRYHLAAVPSIRNTSPSCGSLLFPEKEAKSVVPLRGRSLATQFSAKLTLGVGHAPKEPIEIGMYSSFSRKKQQKALFRFKPIGKMRRSRGVLWQLHKLICYRKCVYADGVLKQVQGFAVGQFTRLIGVSGWLHA